MEEVDFSEKEIADFKDEISFLSPHELKTFLAIPAEILKARLQVLKNTIQKSSMKDAVRQFVIQALQSGFTLGYHVSAHQISQKEMQNGSLSWNIQGTEMDDRDQLMRAYYSLDYENIFREKSAHYLYVIRAMRNNSSYRVDETTHWGRASSLSVIGQFDLLKLDT